MNEEKLFKAIGHIDDLLIERSETVIKKRRFKGVMKITAVVAAAALTFLMGAAVVEFSHANIGSKNVPLNVTIQEDIHIPTAEELAQIGAVYVDDAGAYAGQGGMIRSQTVVPSDIFSLYNIPVLMNGEYFTEKNGIHMNYAVGDSLYFNYTLIDNETEAELDFGLTCALKKNYAEIVTLTGGSKYWDCEILTLKDGSKAVVAQGILDGVPQDNEPDVAYSVAHFCHEGRLYGIGSWGTDKAGMISVLEKLGVL